MARRKNINADHRHNLLTVYDITAANRRADTPFPDDYYEPIAERIDAGPLSLLLTDDRCLGSTGQRPIEEAYY
jgi:hypothetical protein